MSVSRKETIKILEEISLLLELKGENPFKIRAYQSAARALTALQGDFETLVRTGEIANSKGFGKALVEKLTELVETGKLEFLERLRAEFPESLRDLLKIGGIGPKKVKLFYETLNITTVSELEAACKDGRIATLSGSGKKTAEKILESIKRAKTYQAYFLFFDAENVAKEILEALKDCPAVQRLELAGSLRRFKEFTKDIDIIGSTENPPEVMNRFVSLPAVSAVLSKGDTKSSVILKNGIQADLRLVPDHIFPFALHHFTGSKEHNVAIRSRAIRQGMKVSEWGLFTKSNDEAGSLLPCADEKAFYARLGLHYIPPELREDMGEIDFAERKEFPRLVTLDDYRGVLHCHTFASDGADSIEELIKCAMDRGHSFLGITDHSKSSFQANGLDADRLVQQIEMIKGIRNNLGASFELFSGVECDIHINGDLDYPDDILEELDYAIVSVHSGFSRTKKEMTRRIVNALEHPRSRILAHPTGRLLLKRDGYDVDIDVIVDAAKENGVAIELNCNPMRMDMDWRHWRKAKDKGVLCSLNPDAHSLDHFDFVDSGMSFCRKGWLQAEDVINCWPVDKLKRFFA